MMHEFRTGLSARLVDQLEQHQDSMPPEELAYYQGCGFDTRASLPITSHCLAARKRRGRPSNKLRRFFYAVDTSPRELGALYA